MAKVILSSSICTETAFPSKHMEFLSAHKTQQIRLGTVIHRLHADFVMPQLSQTVNRSFTVKGVSKNKLKFFKNKFYNCLALYSVKRDNC